MSSRAQTALREGFLFLYFATLTLLAGLRLGAAYRGHHVWIIGDWLINYQGGFVRRGLPGTFFYLLSDLGKNPGWWAAWGIFGVYVLFLGYVYLHLRAQGSLTPYYLLLWSPALFWFPVWDRIGGYRKEILLFALLAWLTYQVSTRPHHCRRHLTLALALAPLLVLSHEALLAYLPYLLMVAGWCEKKGYLTTWPKMWLLFGLLTLLAFGASSLFHGSALHKEAIWHSLEAKGYPLPHEGAINHLSGRLLAEWRANLWLKREHRLWWLLFGLSFPVAGLAFLPVGQRLKALLRLPKNRYFFGISLLMTVALMSVATDWGRFLATHITALFLLTLLERQPIPVHIEPPALHWIYWLASPLYAFVWQWHYTTGIHPLPKPWPWSVLHLLALYKEWFFDLWPLL